MAGILRPSDEMPGAAGVAILSYGFWERRFGKNPAIIGQAVRMNGTPTTVIGVMPQGFYLPADGKIYGCPWRRPRNSKSGKPGNCGSPSAVWLPASRSESAARRNGNHRNAPGESLPADESGLPPVVQNFAGFFIGPNATMLYGAMWGAVGFVLLIACANIANLLLARAMARSREISVRIALGAGRWRIIRQLLIESLMLSAAGGCGGWWIAKWGVRTYRAAIANTPSYFDNVLDYRMDYRVFAYLVIISIATGFLFGLASALRLSKLDINAALKDGGRGSLSGCRRREARKAVGLPSCNRRDGAGRSAACRSGCYDPQLSEYLHRGSRA